MSQQLMKISIPVASSLLALASWSVLAQPSAPPPAIPPKPLAPQALPVQPPPPPRPSRAEPPPGGLTRFDLDFLGGTPRELVAAIQKAMGRSLNAIVPDEFADVKLPALKMEHVNVPQLFDALVAVGRKSEAVGTGVGG